MAHKSFIFVAVFLVVLLGGAAGVYAFDSSRDGRVAKGVTAAGVNIGGLSGDAARAKLNRRLAARVERPIVVEQGSNRFTLSAKDAGIHADTGGMVDEALAKSRNGNVLSRSVRNLTGGTENVRIPARVSYSRSSASKLVSRVAESVDRPAKDATISFPSLNSVKEQPGVRVDTASLRSKVLGAMTRTSNRTVKATVDKTEAKVTQAKLAAKYPTLLIVNRGAFSLSLYKNLKLVHTYKVAVGQVGLETPAGLYHIQNKGENVPWNVPNSAWAGDLAGTTVPGGAPDNPIKARWMGIFDGAGIHGTDELNSLGSAASHGCIRMAIPDVISLYPQVPVQTPIYIS